MALVGVELETLVFEPDAKTTRPPPCANLLNLQCLKRVKIKSAISRIIRAILTSKTRHWHYNDCNLLFIV